jgi:hypothetical protein
MEDFCSRRVRGLSRSDIRLNEENVPLSEVRTHRKENVLPSGLNDQAHSTTRGAVPSKCAMRTRHERSLSQRSSVTATGKLMQPYLNRISAILIFGAAVGACSLQAGAQTINATGDASGSADQRQSDTSHSANSLQKTVPSSPAQDTGGFIGTVTDTNGDVVPGATIALDELSTHKHRVTIANDNGGFDFTGLPASTSYRLTVTCKGFISWTSPLMNLSPGQQAILSKLVLRLEGGEVSVTVRGDQVEIATEQVELAEKQRVLGFIPNFYVVYNSADAVPLTTKLKYKLALRTSTDPVTMGGVLFLASIKQASDTPNYQQGWLGYGQRVGATAADGFTDIMLGGAVLPSLLHQDPRYYYQGTGSNASRLRHALMAPFICKGDNGKWQPNYSSLGGDLGSASLSNLYYPESNRGAGLVFGNFAVSTAERMLSTTLQEFVLRHFTSKGK